MRPGGVAGETDPVCGQHQPFGSLPCAAACTLPVQPRGRPGRNLEADLPLGEGALRWDEFAPNLYDVTVWL